MHPLGNSLMKPKISESTSTPKLSTQNIRQVQGSELNPTVGANRAKKQDKIDNQSLDHSTGQFLPDPRPLLEHTTVPQNSFALQTEPKVIKVDSSVIEAVEQDQESSQSQLNTNDDFAEQMLSVPGQRGVESSHYPKVRRLSTSPDLAASFHQSHKRLPRLPLGESALEYGTEDYEGVDQLGTPIFNERPTPRHFGFQTASMQRKIQPPKAFASQALNKQVISPKITISRLGQKTSDSPRLLEMQCYPSEAGFSDYIQAQDALRQPKSIASGKLPVVRDGDLDINNNGIFSTSPKRQTSTYSFNQLAMPHTKADQNVQTHSSGKTVDKVSSLTFMKKQSSSGSYKQQLFEVSRGETRLQKVRRYLLKKSLRQVSVKKDLGGRKRVAQKKLRVEGKFVTREQAFKRLGLTQDELLTNSAVQQLLVDQSERKSSLKSVIKHGQAQKLIKVQNFQALIDQSYSHRDTQSRTGDPETCGKNDQNRALEGQQLGQKVHVMVQSGRTSLEIQEQEPASMTSGNPRIFLVSKHTGRPN